jgi:hypothetical protein
MRSHGVANFYFSNSNGTPSPMSEKTGIGRGAGLRRVATAVALGAVALLVAACGGGSHGAGPSSSPSQGVAQQIVAYAHCLRGHGEPNAYVSSSGSAANAPDSAVHVMGYNITGITIGSAQFAAAMKACKHLIPLGPRQPMTQQQKNQLLTFAACMRAHGYPAYPDPQFQHGGVVEQPLPSSIDTTSPQFDTAQKTCSAAAS